MLCMEKAPLNYNQQIPDILLQDIWVFISTHKKNKNEKPTKK